MSSSPKQKLDSIRSAIEEIDEFLLILLSNRISLAEAAGEAKREMEKNLYDPEREEELREILKEIAPEGVLDEDVTDFQEIVTTICRRHQM